MRILKILRNPELKGILALVAIAGVLGVVLLALTGRIKTLFGIPLTLRKPLTDSIAFVSDRSGHPDIWVMKADGSGQKALTNDEYDDLDPTVSPDGHTIVFVSKRAVGKSQLYAMDADGTHLHRLTELTGTKSHPRFSPDGNQILFLCAEEVWSIGANGENPERVLPTLQEAGVGRASARGFSYRWAANSPEGDLIAAVQHLEDREVAVWMRPGDEMPRAVADASGGRTVVLSGEAVGAAWAPGSKRLAVTMTDRSGNGVMAIADLDTSSVRPVLSGPALGSPSWSPDGSSLVLEALRRTGPAEYAPTGLMLTDLSAGTARPAAKGETRQPIWSPDGRRIIYVLGKDIYAYDVQTGRSANLTKGRGSNSDPAPSPAAK